MASEIKIRDPLADALKALAILGVVWIHVSQGDGDLAVYMRFAVPAFVALWAHYFEAGLAKRSHEQQKTYVIDRLRKLLIPYFFWSLLYAVYWQITKKNPPFRVSPIEVLKLFSGKGWPGQYFLLALLQLVPVLLIIRSHLTLKRTWRLLVGFFIFHVIVEFALSGYPVIAEIGHRPFIYWLPYALIGIGQMRGYFDNVPKAIPLVVALIAMVASPFERHWLEERLEDFSPYIQVTVFLMSVGVMLSWPRQSVATSMESQGGEQIGCLGRGASLISQMGGNTFPIFVMNPMVMYWLPGASETEKMGGIEIMVRTAIVTVICLSLGRFLRRLRLGVLVGE